MHIPTWWAPVWSSLDSLQYVGSMWVYFVMGEHTNFSVFWPKKTKINMLLICLCVMDKGDSEDAAADCGCQHVQELLHHRGHVPPSPLLRVCRRCSLWNCQIRREHQPVRILSRVHCPFSRCLLSPLQVACSRYSKLSSVCLPQSQACQLLHSGKGYHSSLPHCHRGRLE